MLIVLVAVLAAAAFAAWPRESHPHTDPCGPVNQQPQAIGVQAAGQVTLCLVNRERTERGLPPLAENGVLDAASLEHSQDMVHINYFEHTSVDGRTVAERLHAAGYQRGVRASGGENIAYGVGREATPASIVDAWMHSPGHRADILRPTFTEIGIGVALGAPEVSQEDQGVAATYTTDFGGVFDPSLPTG